MPNDTRAANRVEALHTLVERWFFDAFHGSPVARSTEIWNHVHAAKEELQQRLAAAAANTAEED